AQQRTAAAGPIVPGLGVANLDAVRANSNAFKTAQQQRPTTYKAQIDQANSRATQLQAQLKPLADKFDADRRAANPNQAALQQQYGQIQQLQQSGQDEINRIMQPVALSEAYVVEQINDKLGQAIKQAIAKRKISLLITPDSIIDADNAYNMNQPILDELNVLLPSAQLVPPAGWEPREVREQKAAAAARQQGGAAAPAQPAGPQPQGR
ncbi:MAG TPA: OmpH family outer membrane protein, partial [Novosphingobium sp.]